MKKKSTLYIIIGAICVLLLIGLFYLYTPEEKNKNKVKNDKELIEKKINDWENKKYDPKAYDPYGTYIFYQLLRNSTNKIRILKRNSQYKNLDTVNHQQRMYVVVVRKFKTHYKRIEKILSFVYRGNYAFIAADVFPEQILGLIDTRFEAKRSYYSDISMNFNNENHVAKFPYKLKFIHRNKNKYRYWTDFYKKPIDLNSYFSSNSYNADSNEYNEDSEDEEYNYVLQDSMFKELEFHTVNYNTVYLSVNYGKGKIFLHTVPYSFTNIVMKHYRGMEHAEKVISYLPNVPIIYDTYLPRVNGSGDRDDDSPKKRSSPLQFILENRSLRWAYYILLSLLLIYILFKGKRKQKIIAPKETFENSSVEFADTMSKLYLQYGQHKYLVYQQERNFMSFVRSRYYIHGRKADEEFKQKLAVKSGIDSSKINEIFERFNKVRSNNKADDNDVVQIHALIEYFNKNCK